jgi:hypothetical protein
MAAGMRFGLRAGGATKQSTAAVLPHGLAAVLPHGLAAVLLLGMVTLLGQPLGAQAQQQGYGQTIQGASGTGSSGASELGPGMGKGNSVLDAVNPIDLMNRIRKGQALDDATQPSDAIDQALRELNSQPGPALTSPSAAVKGP